MSYALTFDDGPGPSMAPLLDALAAGGARATFFLLGCNVEEPRWTVPVGAREVARAVVVRALREGHWIGNHSYSHRYPIDPTELVAEVERVDGLVRGLRAEAGVDRDAPVLVRLPYGPQGPGDRREAALRAAGREHVHWTGGLYDDWKGRPPADVAAELARHVEECEAQGRTAVLTLHASGRPGSSHGFDRSATVEAVRLFLDEANRRGWCSAPVTGTGS